MQTAGAFLRLLSNPFFKIQNTIRPSWDIEDCKFDRISWKLCEPTWKIKTNFRKFSNITHQPTLREAWPNTAPFFFKAYHRKFILAIELFIPRWCFKRHSTDKRFAKFSWLPLQVIFSFRCCKPQQISKIGFNFCNHNFFEKTSQ